MSTPLATAALTAAGLLPLPVPLLPTAEPTAQTQHTTAVEVSGTLQAPDGRLRRGCKDYQYTYAVTTASQDWSFDITLQDRRGKGVNAQSLLGPNDATSGVVTYRLCRWGTVPGTFTLTGALTSYDGAEATSVTVTDSFRLRRRHR